MDHPFDRKTISSFDFLKRRNQPSFFFLFIFFCCYSFASYSSRCFPFCRPSIIIFFLTYSRALLTVTRYIYTHTYIRDVYSVRMFPLSESEFSFKLFWCKKYKNGLIFSLNFQSCISYYLFPFC